MPPCRGRSEHVAVATGKIVVPFMSTAQVFIRSTFNFERGMHFSPSLQSPRKGRRRAAVRFPFGSRPRQLAGEIRRQPDGTARILEIRAIAVH
jgi:hypothetical protein